MTGWTVEIAYQKPFYIFFFFIAFLILAAIKSIDFQSLSHKMSMFAEHYYKV